MNLADVSFFFIGSSSSFSVAEISSSTCVCQACLKFAKPEVTKY